MRTFFTWILLIAIIIGGAYFGSPWWTVWNLERAAKAGDSHAVASVVDFPAVRASLTPELTRELQAALAKEQVKPHTLLEKFTLFASKLLAPKPVDTLVTPEGVTYMLKTGAAPPWNNPLAREHPAPPAGQPTLDAGHSWYMADDLDQFHATVANKVYPGRAVSLKLLRRGFITWKVVGLDLVKTSVSTSTTTTTTTSSGSSGDYAPANGTAH